MFNRDAVRIRTEAEKSPQVMANAINFAILTANAPLRVSVNASIWARTHRDLPGVSYGDITQAEKSLMGAAMTSSKLAWIQNVTATQDTLYKHFRDMDAIEFWNLLLDTVPGLGMVKAAFAVQMLYNELGCIDTHNLRELGADRNMVVGKTANKRAGYLNLQAVKTSQEWWDSWCHFVAERYPGQFDSGDYVSRVHSLAVVGV